MYIFAYYLPGLHMFFMNNGIPVVSEEQERIVVIIGRCQTDTMQSLGFQQ